ncbi:MAG: hypothetical protein ACT4PE_01985 [Candidatus Eiseniibacteriota bacterium]
MMFRRHKGVARSLARACRTGAVVAILCAFAGEEASAVAPPSSRKMAQQIEVMEKILDQVLLDSPNFLIRGTPVARGVFIPSFGALFSFDASLTGEDWEHLKNWSFPGFKIEEHDGKKVIIIDEDGDVVTEEIEGPEDYEADDDRSRDPRDRRRDRQERTYGRGKTEIVDVLLDYGETLSTLEPNQWVAVMAHITDEEFIDRARMSHLILKAKMSDLRAYTAGSLSEEEMIKRIVQEEY